MKKRTEIKLGSNSEIKEKVQGSSVREDVLQTALLYCETDEEGIKQRERRLAKIILTAALRKWKREQFD